VSPASLLAAVFIKVTSYGQFVFFVSAESFVLAGVTSHKQQLLSTVITKTTTLHNAG
jgi:hypothetical protein